MKHIYIERIQPREHSYDYLNRVEKDKRLDFETLYIYTDVRLVFGLPNEVSLITVGRIAAIESEMER